MTTFVEVPASAIHALMAKTGFKKAIMPRSKEEVFELVHKRNARYVVRVYTSIPNGQKVARDCGADAIRVVAVFEDPRTGKTHGIYKAKRIHRTGSIEKVIDRMHDRMREAYIAISSHLEEERRQKEERERRPRRARDDGRTGHVVYTDAAPTDAQLAYIRSLGGNVPSGLTRGAAAKLIDKLKSRRTTRPSQEKT